MKANRRATKSKVDDEGVSPVIAVILMVAITVVLAATVYVWVSGFATEDSGPESASATARGLDSDSNGEVDTIRLTLVRGESAPYNLSLTGGDYASDTEFIVSGSDTNSAIGAAQLLDSVGGSALTDDWGWNVGGSLFIDCDGAGNHAITVSVGASGQKTTILDSTINCDE